MSEHHIAELFDIPNRFLRSAHLERDFSDPRALEGYIFTEPMHQALNRIVAGVRPDSGQRAWRVTGDYGTGKSSFGLLLAHVLAGRSGKLPRALAQAVDLKAIGFPKKPSLYPLLITGARESLTSALSRAILAAIEPMRDGKRVPPAVKRIQEKLEGGECTEGVLMRALADLSAHLVGNGLASGLLLVLDELGKFLEHCALNANADVYTLQRLAEAAARSGDRPLVVVGLLHQGFHVYAEQLPGTAQQEWQKVAGRFEEVVFDQPLQHTSILVSGALNVDAEKLPNKTAQNAKRSMVLALKHRWYGNGADERMLKDRAAELYPLHPFVLPPLVRFLRRYGQHERSLFGFLLSSEPFGLQDFATRLAGAGVWYRLPDLYDYVRANFGHLLGGQSHRSHWLRLSSMIDGLRGTDEGELRVLKTVGILNLLDAEDLIATADVIAAALGATDGEGTAHVSAAIASLKGRNLLYDRGTAGGYCLWPHTSVSLEKAFRDAELAQEPVDRVSSRIAVHLDRRPLVARRHHITTGTLRHFEVRFVPVTDLGNEALLAVPDDADGLVLVPLCDTPAEHLQALEFAQTGVAASHTSVLFAVSEPLRNLAGIVRRVECWDWVVKNTPALTHDRFAAEEAARGRSAAQRELRNEIDNLVGLRGPSPAASLRWFHRGQRVTIENGRELMERLSSICDDLFAESPRIANELVNRRSLSSAGTRGRQLLIEHLLTSAHLPMLGIDAERAPPEKSIYLSILKLGGIHQKAEGAYTIAEPSPDNDVCHLRPTFARIRALLAAQSDARVKVDTIAAELRRPPYGVRDGVWPLLLAIYIKAHEHELAFYEDGAYLVQVGGAELQRLMKAPGTFEMQLCQVVGVRAEVFDRLLTLLDVSAPTDRKPALLDIVTPLCTFAAHLPEYVRKTAALSEPARAVRAALLNAQEPVKLLFQDLPRACGGQSFSSADPVNDAKVQAFVRTLRVAQNELRDAYAALQKRNEAALHLAMGNSSDSAGARARLSARALRALIAVRETRLKAFCLRLKDDALPADRWMEAIASLVVSKPPARWTDADERLYIDEIAGLGETFQRVEAVAFAQGNVLATNGCSAVRVLLTRGDGTEVAQVIDVTDADEPEVARIEGAISEILKRSTRLGLAATSRAFWKALSQGA